MNCPLCKTNYSIEGSLEELWRDKVKYYQCNNPNGKHEFCEHILKATRKDMNSFSCENCDSPLDDCNCFDCCMIFCEECNAFVALSCSNVVQITKINEEAKT